VNDLTLGGAARPLVPQPEMPSTKFMSPAGQLIAATPRAASTTTAHTMRSMRSRIDSRAECSRMKPVPSNVEANRPIDR
jgi:hypothetical protein